VTKSLALLEEAFSALSLSERGQEVQDNFKNLCLELFSNWPILFQYNGKSILAYINEVEYASSRFGDEIKEHPLQQTIGSMFVHRHPKAMDKWAPPKMLSFDITCGSDLHYGTLLVRSVELDGEVVLGSGRSFRKIYETLGVGKEAYHELDGRNLLDENSSAHFNYQPRKTAVVSLLNRESIAGSGALLRASWGQSVVPKKVPNIKIQSEDVSPPTQKVQDHAARSRYQSIINRSFERDYEAYLFDCLMQAKVKAVELEKFLQFAFTKSSEIEDWKETIAQNMDEEYTSHDFLRYKNKVLEAFNENNEGLKKEFKKVYRQRFGERLQEAQFAEFFRSADHCYYCKITLTQLKDLSERKLIKTKRKYIKGKSLEIDKKDPNGFYEIDNMVLCCYWCNNAKTDEYTAEEFLEVSRGVKSVWDQRLKSD
jgi:5-methylcytosine-specific restriction endonuclease McrA